MKEYLERLSAAQDRFDWAVDPKDIDAAIYELQSAEISLDSYVEKQKENEEFV